MSFEEHDPLEIAKDLQANSDLGRSDFSEPRADEPSGGMSRRDLLVRGGVGAAAVAGAGMLGGAAKAATSHTAKKGAFTGTLNVITLGVEFPTPEVAQKIKKDLGFDVNLTVDRPGHGGPEGDHRARRRSTSSAATTTRTSRPGRRRRPASDRHEEDHGLASALQAVRVGQGATPARRPRRTATATHRSARSSSSRGRRGCRSRRKGRSPTRTSSSGSTRGRASRTAAADAALHRRRRRPTSTPTRSATTPTSSRSSRTRSAGRSS